MMRLALAEPSPYPESSARRRACLPYSKDFSVSTIQFSYPSSFRMSTRACCDNPSSTKRVRRLSSFFWPWPKLISNKTNMDVNTFILNWILKKFCRSKLIQFWNRANFFPFLVPGRSYPMNLLLAILGKVYALHFLVQPKETDRYLGRNPTIQQSMIGRSLAFPAEQKNDLFGS